MIKEVTNKKESMKAEFPKFMIGSMGNIILATSIRGNRICGTIVSIGKSTCEIGEYSDDWDLFRFTDYNEPITLQNETE